MSAIRRLTQRLEEVKYRDLSANREDVSFCVGGEYEVITGYILRKNDLGAAELADDL
jgi:hypothetical protein